MDVALLLPSYALWHYSTGFKDLYQFCGNILWFLYHFFSLPLLLRTFFSPWRRLEEHERGDALGNFIVNTALRLVGIIVRLGAIIVGIISLVVLSFLALLSFILWITLPLAIPVLLVFGIISLTL